MATQLFQQELPLPVPSPPTVAVTGARLALIDYERTLDWIEAMAATGERGYVCVCNVHTVTAAREDDELRAALQASSFNVPDGQPLVWALAALGYRLSGRVYGPELMARACARAAGGGLRFYLYGGRNQGALVQLALNLRRRYPGINIVGGYAPPHRELTAEEGDAIVDEINRSRADVVWVGIGVPKQEKWMARMRGRLDAPVLVGVGAAFDFHAGLVPQAPPWVQRVGLEWFYRLVHEPRRLWKRYLRYNPRFVYALANQLLSERQRAQAAAQATATPRPRRLSDGFASQLAAPVASIVIPTRKRPGYLDAALASVVPQAEQVGAEVIVVNDGADPVTTEVATSYGATVVALPQASGANAARNVGLREARGELVLLIDDDISAPDGWLQALLDGAEASPDRDVFGGPIRPALAGGGPSGCGRESAPITSLELGSEDHDVELVWSANMAIRRRALDAVGPFDETLFVCGDEEDWVRRYNALGGRVRYLAAAGVEHRRAAADATLRSLARAAYRRGVAARRYDLHRGAAPPVKSEVRTLAGCAWHVVHRRCATGIVLGAEAAGRLRESLLTG
jgi:N-acetylglucosaminyldiphosphoundecaprenol N-acetyl-beta-D-mannosaminyltransferase